MLGYTLVDVFFRPTRIKKDLATKKIKVKITLKISSKFFLYYLYVSPLQKQNHMLILLLLLLLSRFSHVRLCANPQMAAHQAPLSLGFSRQEYLSALPLPSLMVILFTEYSHEPYLIMYVVEYSNINSALAELLKNQEHDLRVEKIKKKKIEKERERSLKWLADKIRNNAT